METKQRHNVFCRCGHARSLTGFGLRHICGVSTCECVKHDTAKADKSEDKTNQLANDLDSLLAARMLMAGTIADQAKRIETATRATTACLMASKAGAPRTAGRYAEMALRALGGLGAS